MFPPLRNPGGNYDRVSTYQDTVSQVQTVFNTVKTTVKLEVQLNKVETNGGPEYEGVSWIPRVARRPMTLTESDFFRRRYFF
jgi:hypothetical protein